MIYPDDLRPGDEVFVIVRDTFVNRDSDEVDCDKYEFDAEDVVGVLKVEW